MKTAAGAAALLALAAIPHDAWMRLANRLDTRRAQARRDRTLLRLAREGHSCPAGCPTCHVLTEHAEGGEQQ